MKQKEPKVRIEVLRVTIPYDRKRHWWNVYIYMGKKLVSNEDGRFRLDEKAAMKKAKSLQKLFRESKGVVPIIEKEK